MSTFADHDIVLPPGATGREVATTCPECSRTRKKKNAKCLSVNIEKQAWHCNHCGWSGGLSDRPAQRPRQPRQYRRPEPRPENLLSAPAYAWFKNRAIPEHVLKRNRIENARVYFSQFEEEADAVVFPYFRNGELVNRKYRTIKDKYFRMEPGCELILYGVDDIDQSKPLVWCEGEADKLALEAAGFFHVVSVPNGAPAPGIKNYESLFPFLESAQEKLDAIQKHILAVDADTAGAFLETELARRLGTEKCWRVTWPEGCKDANEVLMKHGPEEVCWYIENAEPYPIDGAFEISQRRDDLRRLYQHGFERGKRTGWIELDKFYTVRPGEFTAVTGIPSSGKSNFIDALIVNLARMHDWRFAIFSPENLPLEHHMAAIVEKYAGKPFHEGSTERMTTQEFDAAMEWVGEHFTWILPSNEDSWTLDKILLTAEQLCLRNGIRGLVIDPWNELEPLRPSAMTETEYISQCLKHIRVFARQRGVHVWVVVHPAKLTRDKAGKYPVPTLYDCAGSAHWRNKSDNGITVWRDLSAERGDLSEVSIYVQKIRFRQIGRRGKAILRYEPACATYRDYRAFHPPVDDDWGIQPSRHEAS